MANMIGKANAEHGYSQTLFNNWHEVFGDDAYILTKTTPNKYNLDEIRNIMLCNFQCLGSVRLAQVNFFDRMQPQPTIPLIYTAYDKKLGYSASLRD